MSIARMILVSVCLAAGSACGGTPPAKTADAKPQPASEETPAAKCIAKAGASNEPAADAPDQAALSHILVRHKDLKRPEGATRTRGEACLRAQAAREKLLAGAEWAGVSEEFNDAAGATGGDLGTVSKEQLDSRFGDAAFALGAGELSHVVETERGFHVIARTE